MTGIKIAIAYVTFLVGKAGIKHFSPELLEDIQDHPLMYTFSCTTGVLTYIKLPSFLETSVVGGEIIKMCFAVFTTFLVLPLSFILRKILEYYYSKYFKKYENNPSKGDETNA